MATNERLPVEISAGELCKRHSGTICPKVETSKYSIVRYARRKAGLNDNIITCKLSPFGTRHATYFRKLRSGHDGTKRERRDYTPRERGYRYHLKATMLQLERYNVIMHPDPNGIFYWQGRFWRANDKRCKQWLKRHSDKCDLT